jgi:hypothetical protein
MSNAVFGLYIDTGNNPCEAIFDSIRICQNTDPQIHTSGSYTSPIYTYTTNISKLLIFDKRYFFHPSCGAISLDISLDGGAHWKTNITDITQVLDAGIGGILENPDTGGWSVKTQLRIRYNISRGSFTYPMGGPELGGYGVVVKAELA